MTRRRIFSTTARARAPIVALCLAVLFAVTGCGSASNSGGAATGDQGFKTPYKIKLGTAVAGAFFIPMYVAHEAGYYRDEGLDVELLAFNGGSDLMAAMASGSIQVAGGATSSMVSAVAEGVPTKVVYGLLNTLPFDIIVAKDINGWSDLKGKKAGVSGAGSLTDTTMRLVLAQHGLTPDNDVTLLESGGGDAPRLAALSAGQIQITAVSPGARPLVQKLQGKVLLSAEKFDLPFQGNAIVARTSFISGQPAVLKAIVRATMRGAAALQDKSMQATVRQAINKDIGVKDDAVTSAYYDYASAGRNNPAIFPISGEVPDEGIQTILTSRAADSPKVGALKIEQIVDRSIVDALAGYAKELQAKVKPARLNSNAQDPVVEPEQLEAALDAAPRGVPDQRRPAPVEVVTNRGWWTDTGL
jgi:NitT/TauT family transport system substrate-binding protein